MKAVSTDNCSETQPPVCEQQRSLALCLGELGGSIRLPDVLWVGIEQVSSLPFWGRFGTRCLANHVTHPSTRGRSLFSPCQPQHCRGSSFTIHIFLPGHDGEIILQYLRKVHIPERDSLLPAAVSDLCSLAYNLAQRPQLWLFPVWADSLLPQPLLNLVVKTEPVISTSM